MYSYSEARQLLINNLTHDATAHEAGRFQDIGLDFDELDYNLPRDGGPEFDKLLLALTFWDGWIDARNHEWQYYEGIEEGDWPVLARRIAQALEMGDEITEPKVLARFRPPARQPVKERIKWLLDRARGNH